MQILPFLISALFAGVFGGVASGNPAPVSDSVLLTEAFTRCLRTLLYACPHTSEDTVFMSFTGGTDLSPEARKTAEALFTEHGYIIAHEPYTAGLTCSMTVSGIRVIYMKTDDRFSRSAGITVHLTVTDSKRRVLYSSGREEILSDWVPEYLTRDADDCSRFSESLKRITLSNRHTGFCIVSFLVITGVLVYLAF